MIHNYACATCNGTGVVNDDHDLTQTTATCLDCDGTGIDNRD
ncbi:MULTISPECIES: hypothetical protein [unclassified Nonomuraea]